MNTLAAPLHTGAFFVVVTKCLLGKPWQCMKSWNDVFMIITDQVKDDLKCSMFSSTLISDNSRALLSEASLPSDCHESFTALSAVYMYVYMSTYIHS